MASRILLISANRCTSPDPVFPLGLACLNAALREAGHQCAWLDTLADGERFEQVLKETRPTVVGISLRNIDDILIRKRETFFDNLPGLVRAVRGRVHCPIIVGGSGFSIFPRELFEMADADFGIAGEGEAGFLALLAALENGAEFRSIPGLVFRENGVIKINRPVPNREHRQLSEADRPAPVVDHYLRTGSMLNVQTQRGCAFRCCYCTYPVVEGRQHRRRPPDVIAAEFEQLQRAGVRYVFIVDSVFNSSAQHVSETCEALLRRGVNVAWGCFLRPQGLTPELMRLMARAGLKHIEFGTDSFCDAVLAAYHKDFRFEEILLTSELARRENIDYCHFLIAGGPGETYETLETGFSNSQRLRGAVIMAVVGMRIYPGTHLYEQALAEGQITRETSLLTPAYYLAPGLETEQVFGRLQEFARRSSNWIAGDPSPGYQNLVSRLRQRGIAGPLWSYFSMIQRLFPEGAPGR